MVFESLNKCCKCKKPCNYSQDIKGNYYCKRHHRLMPIKLRETGLWSLKIIRFPRKYKKLLSRAVLQLFKKENIKGKVTLNKYGSYSCNNRTFPIHFKRVREKLIKNK